MSLIETRWKCGSCGDIHEDESDAHECCQPSVSEVYICPVCGAWHRGEDAAQECCPNEGEDGDAEGCSPTAAELEAQGQMRLILDQGARP
ncbi:hypothetical protein [Janthinobacterium sp. UMAB-56]|uniref:hypothetical protein n=1 Tax=Janthinobacterium sp. UMAB-56 TaxID=1365361 RepID=UPI001C571160|nr:hypothetical protein [Janthinobacterium sp. UMAB-56]